MAQDGIQLISATRTEAETPQVQDEPIAITPPPSTAADVSESVMTEQTAFSGIVLDEREMASYTASVRFTPEREDDDDIVVTAEQRPIDMGYEAEFGGQQTVSEEYRQSFDRSERVMEGAEDRLRGGDVMGALRTIGDNPGHALNYIFGSSMRDAIGSAEDPSPGSTLATREPWQR